MSAKLIFTISPQADRLKEILKSCGVILEPVVNAPQYNVRSETYICSITSPELLRALPSKIIKVMETTIVPCPKEGEKVEQSRPNLVCISELNKPKIKDQKDWTREFALFFKEHPEVARPELYDNSKKI